MIKPVVLIEIDRNSRLQFLATDGVLVGFIDRRVDPVLVLWPEQNQIEAILASLAGVPVISPGNDDPLGSAVATLQSIRAGLTVVAGGPRILTKFGEPVE